jgi:hypothetical protein
MSTRIGLAKSVRLRVTWADTLPSLNYGQLEETGDYGRSQAKELRCVGILFEEFNGNGPPNDTLSIC